MTVNTQKIVNVLSGFTGPTGTFEVVNIIPNFTGPTGLYPQWAAYTGPTGASMAKGIYKNVVNIGPTGPSSVSPGKGIKTVTIPGFSSGGGGGGASTIWNIADSGPGTYALSNTNLTATFTSGGATSGIRSTNLRTAGKLYFEGFCNQVGFRGGFGVANHNAILGAFRFTNVDMLIVQDGGGVSMNNSTVATLTGGDITGHTLCFAIDFGAKLAWCRDGAGQWNGSGTADPATGVGGIDITAIISTGLMIYSADDNSPDQHTINVGGSAFAQTKPTGYSAWG